MRTAGPIPASHEGYEWHRRQRTAESRNSRSSYSRTSWSEIDRPTEHGAQPMAWDFSTEPEFQKKLDWVDEFCREEVEPLEYIFPYAVRARDPKVKALVKGLQDQIKDQGLW